MRRRWFLGEEKQGEPERRGLRGGAKPASCHFVAKPPTAGTRLAARGAPPWAAGQAGRVARAASAREEAGPNRTRGSVAEGSCRPFHLPFLSPPCCTSLKPHEEQHQVGTAIRVAKGAPLQPHWNKDLRKRTVKSKWTYWWNTNEKDLMNKPVRRFWK